MQASVQACTRPASRHSANEDRATVGTQVLESQDGITRARLGPPAMIAVLDGVGGAPCAELASDLAARAISAADPPSDQKAARALLARADRLLLDAGELDARRAGMATTIAMVVLSDGGDDHATVVNVGDSLVARLQADGLDEISVSDRIGAKNIFQTLGGFDDPDMRPHATDLDVTPGDRLLLATDGLTDAVDADTIAEVLTRHGRDAAAELLDLVERAGTPDDVTIAVVDIEAGDGGDNGERGEDGHAG